EGRRSRGGGDERGDLHESARSLHPPPSGVDPRQRAQHRLTASIGETIAGPFTAASGIGQGFRLPCREIGRIVVLCASVLPALIWWSADVEHTSAHST